jgi:hypothetical protein
VNDASCLQFNHCSEWVPEVRKISSDFVKL